MNLKILGLAGLLLLSNCQTKLSELDKEEIEPPKREHSLTFSFFDDNTGVLDEVLDVDDMGYTWGSKISYGTDLEKNHLTIDYLTNLYTRKCDDIPTSYSDGHIIVPQNFVDEVSLTATIDNKKQANPWYRDYSFGILSLDSNDDGFFLSASAQQKFYHNLMGLNIPDNQEDSSASQFGLIFGLHKGLYLPIKIRDWLNFSMDLKAGARLSTILDASYLDFGISTDLTFKGKKIFMTNLNLGCNTKLHNNGAQTTLSFGQSFGIGNFQAGINVLKPFGDSFKMYKFDDKRENGYDLIFEWFFKFGS